MCQECEQAKLEGRPPTLARMAPEEQRIIRALLDAQSAATASAALPPRSPSEPVASKGSLATSRIPPRSRRSPRYRLTASGRALLEREAYNARSFALINVEDIERIEVEAVAADRERIAREVALLRTEDGMLSFGDISDEMLAAVFAIIRGETHNG